MKVGLGDTLGTIVQVHFAFSDALVAHPCTCSATKSLKMFCEKYAVNFDWSKLIVFSRADFGGGKIPS